MISVDSIADLRALGSLADPVVTVLGYYTPCDGGGGLYCLDPLDTTSLDNGGTIIVRSDGGRLKLAHTGRVSVKQFGAKGDYNQNTSTGTDDSIAVMAAIKWALTRYADNISAGCIYVPDGQYLVTENNFLGAVNFVSLPGGVPARIYFSMVGDGYNSQIHWKPSGAAGNYWMYDNTPGQNNLIDPLFSNVIFKWDGRNVAVGSTLNAFSEYGQPWYATQGIKFDRVEIVGADYPSTAAEIAKMGVALKMSGTVNADLTNSAGLKVRGLKTLLQIINNAESVCHNFSGSDAEVMYGNIFEIAGGSSVNVFGGSCSMFSQSEAYFVALYSQSVAMVGTFNFYGTRCEFNSPDPAIASAAFSNILKIDGASSGDSMNSTSYKVNFHGCNFYPMVGDARDSINIDAATKASVNFIGCDLSPKHKVGMFSSKVSPNYTSLGPFTQVTFSDGSAVSSDAVTFSGPNASGRVSARNCNGVLDYDLGCNGSSYARIATNRPLKTATIWGTSWSDPGNPNAMFITLPYGAVLKAIRFRKEAYGSSSASYRLVATDGTGALPGYAQSSVGPQNARHDGVADNINRICTDTLARMVYIIRDPANTGSAVATPMAGADFAMVDYY